MASATRATESPGQLDRGLAHGLAHDGGRPALFPSFPAPRPPFVNRRARVHNHTRTRACCRCEQATRVAGFHGLAIHWPSTRALRVLRRQ